MGKSSKIPLCEHDLKEPPVFTPEIVLEAVRSERRLSREPVPEVCVLEFDGDLTDWLADTGKARRFAPWACFHTQLYTLEVDHRVCGVVPRSIGGPYAVLIAEQLAVSGAKVILGLTSAGRVGPRLPIPSLVIPTEAIRDEGTSYHYLPPAKTVDGHAEVVRALHAEMITTGLPVFTGRVWTTDAPYRETRTQLNRHAAEGALAVEMQAASLLAFGEARKVPAGVVAQITNADNHTEEQFAKGGHQLGFKILNAVCRAGWRFLGGQQSE